MTASPPPDPAAAAPPAPRSWRELAGSLELSDQLVVAGGVLIIAGVAFIYWPAAMILAGLGLIQIGIRW